MEQYIYKFLEHYVKDDFHVTKSSTFYNPFNFQPEYNYCVISGDGIIILRFSQRGTMVDSAGEECLSNTICNFFSIPFYDAKMIVKDWFFKKSHVLSVAHFADKYRHLFPM